jgi:hypothetical protein
MFLVGLVKGLFLTVKASLTKKKNTKGESSCVEIASMQWITRWCTRVSHLVLVITGLAVVHALWTDAIPPFLVPLPKGFFPNFRAQSRAFWGSCSIFGSAVAYGFWDYIGHIPRMFSVFLPTFLPHSVRAGLGSRPNPYISILGLGVLIAVIGSIFIEVSQAFSARGEAKKRTNVRQAGRDRKMGIDADDDRQVVDEDVELKGQRGNRRKKVAMKKMVDTFRVYDNVQYEFARTVDTDIDNWVDSTVTTTGLLKGKHLPDSDFDSDVQINIMGLWRTYKIIGRGDSTNGPFTQIKLQRGVGESNAATKLLECSKCRLSKDIKCFSKNAWRSGARPPTHDKHRAPTCLTCATKPKGESKAKYSACPNWGPNVGVICFKIDEALQDVCYFVKYMWQDVPVTFLYKHMLVDMDETNPQVSFTIDRDGSREILCTKMWSEMKVLGSFGDILIVDASDIGIKTCKCPLADAVIPEEIITMTGPKNTRSGKIKRNGPITVRLYDQIVPVIVHDISTTRGECGIPAFTFVDKVWKFVGPHIAGKVAGGQNGAAHLSSLNFSVLSTGVGGGENSTELP